MKASWTHLLLLMLLLGAGSVLAAGSHLETTRSAALVAQRDLDVGRAELQDLTAWHVAVRTDADAADASDFSFRVRQAATTATLADRLVSIEPGPAIRVRESNTVRTPLYLRLDGVSLRALVTFMHELVARDAVVRVTGIELSVPTPSPAAGPELWTADVTLSETAAGVGVAP